MPYFCVWDCLLLSFSLLSLLLWLSLFMGDAEYLITQHFVVYQMYIAGCCVCTGLLLNVLLKYCMKYMLHSLWSVAGCGSLVAMALTYFSPSSTPAWVIRSAMFFSRSSILWPMSSSSLVKEHSINQFLKIMPNMRKQVQSCLEILTNINWSKGWHH